MIAHFKYNCVRSLSAVILPLSILTNTDYVMSVWFSSHIHDISTHKINYLLYSLVFVFFFTILACEFLPQFCRFPLFQFTDS